MIYVPIYYCMHLMTILAAAVLANCSQEHAYMSQHEIILVDLNWYTEKHCAC